jgi:hypothetical protein
VGHGKLCLPFGEVEKRQLDIFQQAASWAQAEVLTMRIGYSALAFSKG